MPRLLCKNNNRQGMVVVLIAVVLALIVLLFASFINRVRMESNFTNKIAANESLYQCASAIGRFAAAKATKDFEYKNRPGGFDLVENIEKGKTSSINMTATIENYGAVKYMLERVREKTKEPIEIKEVSVSIDNLKPIEQGIAGSNSQAFSNEKTGDIVVSVVFDIGGGVKKAYKIVKDFKYVSLLPHPYSRFTLFLSDFIDANNTDDKLNNSLVNSAGVPDEGSSPLLCVNSLISSPGNLLEKDASNNTADTVIDKDLENVVKSGWIYLGSNPRTEFKLAESGSPIRAAAFNISPAHGKTMPQGSISKAGEMEYGESFHFYYEPASQGWLRDAAWTAWLKDKGVSDFVNMACVNFGFFKEMPSFEMFCRVVPNNPPTKKKLFSGAIDVYRSQNYPGINNTSSLNRDSFSYTSTILPFGNTAICTPTLIFGPILRRYFTVFGIYSGDKRLPLFSVGSGDGAGLRTAELISAISIHFQRTILPEQRLRINSVFEQAFEWYNDPFSKWNRIYATTEGLPSSQPQVNHFESYMYVLKNICAPTEPGKDFVSAISSYKGVDTIRPFLGDVEPAGVDLANVPIFNDFNFSSANNYINYSGTISDLAADIDNIELGRRASYILDGPKEDKFFYLYKSHFFQKHFIIKKANIPLFKQMLTNKLSMLTNLFAKLAGISSPSPDIVSELYLNKAVKIDLKKGQTFVIDQPLFVRAGGIIDCGEGDIEIRAPIINEEISIDTMSDITPKEAVTMPKYPFLTLIGNNIRIVIDSSDQELAKSWQASAGGGSLKNRPYALPQLHAILIAKDKLSLKGLSDSPFKGINIVGAVTARDLDTSLGNSILGTKSVIEWGFERDFGKFEKIENGKPYLNGNYYGLTLGPRTHEIFASE